MERKQGVLDPKVSYSFIVLLSVVRGNMCYSYRFLPAHPVLNQQTEEYELTNEYLEAESGKKSDDIQTRQEKHRSGQFFRIVVVPILVIRENMCY